MDLGKRLKQARLDAGLSQRQLCGDTITRNMLSLIENGSAQPSMDTLRILAARLGKPVGFFLEEPAADPMEEAWQAFFDEDFPSVLTLTEALTPTPQCRLLRGRALLALANAALCEGRVPLARDYLQKAEDCKTVPIWGAELERQRLLLLYRLPSQNPSPLARQLTDDAELLLRAAAALADGEPHTCKTLLSCCQNQSCRQWLRLAGDSRFALEDYAGAIPCYLEIEDQCLDRLEQCYEKLGDYRLAYHYACRQRNNKN